jgi:pilus assembly protein CpaE
MDSVRVLIVAPITEVSALLHELPIGEESRGLSLVNFVQDGATAFKYAEEFDVSLVLLSPNVPNFDINVIARLSQYPKRPIVTIGLVPMTGDWAVTFQRAGAAAHLLVPATQATVEQLLAMAPSLIQKAYEERAKPTYIPQIDAQTAAMIAASGYQRQIVASYSPKGGVGKTTMGVNLATLLGVIANRPTILIDTNMNGGHIALHLNLKHSYTIYTLARDFLMQNNQLTPQLVRQHLTHYSGSLDVLVGISRMEQAGEEYLAGQQGETFIACLLDTAQQMADFVVLDMGSSYNNALHRTALRRAHAILLLVTPDVTAVEDARKALETLKLFMDVSRDRVQLVINYWTQESGLRLPDIVNRIKLPSRGAIPWDQSARLTHSVNVGRPHSLVAFEDAKLRREDEVLRAMIEIASSIYPPMTTIYQAGLKAGMQTQPKQGGLLGLFKGI